MCYGFNNKFISNVGIKEDVGFLLNASGTSVSVIENILVAPMDYPGQKNVHRAVVHRMINGERSDVPPQILNIVPFIVCITQSLAHAKFLLKSHGLILIFVHAFKGWSLVKESVKNLFFNCKVPEACMFINLLDDVIPLVLDFYPIIFRSGCWEVYEEAMLRMWKFFIDTVISQNMLNMKFDDDKDNGEDLEPWRTR
ncbi:unnamed protein product [Rhizophagus irregularis]|nr:unnamed protein product [Rhizophagus irregularis]